MQKLILVILAVGAITILNGYGQEQQTQAEKTILERLEKLEKIHSATHEWRNLLILSKLRLWLAADCIQAQDNEKVRIWIDQSGLGNSPIAPDNETIRPIYKSGAILGHPAVRFQKGQDFRLFGSKHFNFTAATIFTVTSKLEGNFVVSIFQENTENEHTFYVSVPNIMHHSHHHSYTYLDHQENPTTPHIRTAVMGTNPKDLELYINGVLSTKSILDTTGNPYFVSLDPFPAVARNVCIGFQTTAGFDGDIAEILIYEGKLNDSERMTVEAYLSTKYGIPVYPKY